MIKCPLTDSSNVKVIYEQKGVPLIQNKVYPSERQAREAPCTNVQLAQSLVNGFVFSANFTAETMDYDIHYQNEQANSVYFRSHLDHVIAIMKDNHLLNGNVVEIGCGKAFFFDMLVSLGVKMTGFDPTYEGNSPLVIRDFFSSKYSDVNADFIILRHTLEHIEKPFDFIKTIAAANNFRGKIFIEVPTFDWIVKHNAIEDIFHEHCNYFTLDTLRMFFKASYGGTFFNGQYIYVIADLGTVKDAIGKREFTPQVVKFDEQINRYREMLDSPKNHAIWGAGAKGSTFLNILDKDRKKVKCVVDINPKKQQQYLGGTGHPIIGPSELQEYNIDELIIMNSNYLDEIRPIAEQLKINIKIL